MDIWKTKSHVPVTTNQYGVVNGQNESVWCFLMALFLILEIMIHVDEAENAEHMN